MTTIAWFCLTAPPSISSPIETTSQKTEHSHKTLWMYFLAKKTNNAIAASKSGAIKYTANKTSDMEDIPDINLIMGQLYEKNHNTPSIM